MLKNEKVKGKFFFARVVRFFNFGLQIKIQSLCWKKKFSGYTAVMNGGLKNLIQIGKRHRVQRKWFGISFTCSAYFPNFTRYLNSNF